MQFDLVLLMKHRRNEKKSSHQHVHELIDQYLTVYGVIETGQDATSSKPETIPVPSLATRQRRNTSDHFP